MVATYPRNIDQIQAGAPRPCLSCYGLSKRWCYNEFVVYDHQETLFKRRQTNFQPKATIRLRLAYVRRARCSRKNGERGKRKRAVIQHFHLKKWTAAQIKAELDTVHGDTAPKLKTLYFKINEFKDGRTSTKDEAIVLSDAQGIILIDYLQKGQTITEEYYATLLSRLHEKLGTEPSKLAHKKIISHHDNAPTHTSADSMINMHELGFKLLPHLPYSPDLALPNFFLFSNLKISGFGERNSRLMRRLSTLWINIL